MAYRTLSQYPWHNGSGIGIHLGYDDKHRDNELIQMKVNVVLDIHGDVDRAKWFSDRKVNVLFRPYGPCESRGPINPNLAALQNFCDAVRQRGLPLYVQIFNEVGPTDEMVDNWIKAADVVVKNGGFPGVQVLPDDTIWGFLDRLRSRGRIDLMENGWINCHNYPWNHPWNYPYDDINQKTNPNQTIFCHDGAQSAFGFLYTDKLVSDFFGQRKDIVPILIGEGGATVDPEMYRDTRYETLHPGWWTSMNRPGQYPHPQLVGDGAAKARDWQLSTLKKLVELLQTGKLAFSRTVSHALPDRVFGYCLWITEDNRSDGNNAWAGEGFWSRIPTRGYPDAVTYLKSLPSFTRATGGGAASTTPTSPVTAQSPFAFQLGFADFARKLGAVAGQPVENEGPWVSASGKYLGQIQEATGGIFHWHKALNRMFFIGTNGRIYTLDAGVVRSV